MRVLVTGAFGFVGASLTHHLAAQGHDVIATDLRLPDRQTRAILPAGNTFSIRLLDVTDAGAARALIHDVQPTHVIHAAALTQTDLDAPTMARTFAVNLGGTMNVLAAAAKGGVSRVVVASSSGVYGGDAGATPMDVPVREEAALTLTGAYAASKRASELVAASYAGLPGLSCVAARIGPVYGPCEQERASRPRVSAVGRLFEALGQGRAMALHGPDVSRDWTHADDIAAGLTALALAPDLAHPVYNLSSGRGVRFQAVADWFVGQGLAIRWVDDPADADLALRASDARRPLDITRITAATGFAPAFDLAAGLAQVRADLGLVSSTALPG